MPAPVGGSEMQGGLLPRLGADVSSAEVMEGGKPDGKVEAAHQRAVDTAGRAAWAPRLPRSSAAGGWARPWGQGSGLGEGGASSARGERARAHISLRGSLPRDGGGGWGAAMGAASPRRCWGAQGDAGCLRGLTTAILHWPFSGCQCSLI